MKSGLLFLLIISTINLLKLIYYGGFDGGKIHVTSNTQSIVFQIILIIFLFVMYIRLPWKSYYTKCPKCKESYDYDSTLKGKCPKCKDVNTIEISKYYEQFPEERSIIKG